VTQYVIILPYETELFIYLYLLFQDTLNISPCWLTLAITHYILCMYRVYDYSVDILIIIVITRVNHTHTHMLKQCDNIVTFGELLVRMLKLAVIVIDTVSHEHIDNRM